MPPFITSYCPGLKNEYDDEYIAKLTTWYANLGSKLHYQAQAQALPPVHNITLHSIWENTTQEWTALQAEVGVRQIKPCYVEL